MDASRDRTTPGRAVLLLCGFRAAVLLAAAASSALYAQYLSPGEGTFCGPDSGCEAVRRAGFSYFGDSPYLSLPLVGVSAFAALYLASLLSRRHAAVVLLAAAGGLAGVGLFATQALVIGAFCWLCVIVDAGAVVAGLLAWRYRATPGPDRDPLALAAWTSLFVLVVAAPFTWTRVKPELPVPEVIRELYVPGKVNVVEFADFECPHCRRLYPSLERVLGEQTPGRVHFARKHVPLPGHPDAKPAARAVICAEEQGKEQALSDRLVEIELSPGSIRRAALEVGVDAARLDQCLASGRPDARIAEDTKRLKTAGMRGLPTTYVGGQRLLGAVSEAKLRDAIERAARGDDGPSGVSGPTFLALLALLLGGVAWFGRNPRATLSHEPRD